MTWSKEIKQEFPDAKVSCIGETTFAENPGSWNPAITARLLEETSHEVDAITLHPYTGVAAVQTLERDNVDWAISSAQNIVSRIDEALVDLPEDIDVWITEYNTFEAPLNPIMTTRWAHGISVASQYLHLALDSRVKLACTHTLSTSSNWASLAAKPESWNERYSLLPEKEFSRTAQGEALARVYAALKNGGVVQALVFGELENTKIPSPVLDSEGDLRENDHAPLFGIRVSSDQGLRLVVINRSADAHNP